MDLSMGNAARRDPAVRAELKRQQRARIALKKRMAAGEIEPSEYSDVYSSQPEQIAKAKENEMAAQIRREARVAVVRTGLAHAKGGADAFEGAAE